MKYATRDLVRELAAIPEEDRTLEQQALLNGDTRINLLVSALKKIMVAGTIALALLLAYLFGQSYEGRQGLVNQARFGCVARIFNTADDIEAAQRNAENWSKASAARKRDGDLDVARVYARNAAADRGEAARKMERLDGADFTVAVLRDARNRPLPAAHAEVESACRRTWPSASPWPWAD